MYGIVQFSRIDRVAGKGVKFQPLDPDTPACFITTKASGCVDRWAKVINNNKNNNLELSELYGPVGCLETESAVLRLFYGVKCRYPHYCLPKQAMDTVALGAFSVDNVGTKDIDDALSVEYLGTDEYRIGVHVTDVTHFYRCNPEFFEWTQSRGASAYWHSGGAQHSQPMMPPEVAHNHLSLCENSVRPCITLWIHSKDGQILDRSHANTFVANRSALSYAQFTTDPQYAQKLLCLRQVTAETDAEDIVAWTMLEYNKYFGNLLVERCGEAMLRTKSGDDPAVYAIGAALEHSGLGVANYAHMSSPIRRFPDVFNQMKYHQLDVPEVDIVALNTRMQQLAHFHYRHSVMELAYECKDTPREVTPIPQEDSVLVYLPERRVRIPKAESWYTPDSIGLGTVPVKMWGITRNGISRLRITTPGTVVLFEPPPEVVPPQEPQGDQVTERWNKDDLKESVQEFLGHPLDEFQNRCLDVLSRGSDLLGMAPTGSGKTAVAMLGILSAFARDKRVVYTSPIKALSNEKYDSLGKKLHGRVSILTGDIKDRAVPPGGDGAGELLIMTAEILRNKLISSATGVLDPDLRDVEVVIQDEVHYINDPERGPVWEETVMLLPPTVQIISLSATLTDPENFRAWLSSRRPTEIVQRLDRHVPLHVGGLSDQSAFVECWCTHGPTGLNTTTYGAISGERSSKNYYPIVRALMKDDKCPAIIFCMSRKGCVHAAGTITKNLMLAPQPKRPPGSDMPDEYFDALLRDHSEEVRMHEERWKTLYNRHLQKHHAAVTTLPQWDNWIGALKRGIGYHHGGMIPILREFVELLFQARMLKVVFATETLGVGINMPARTVVFTQLNKPSGSDGNFRWLRSDEFWQMAGRAGRRGMDDHGYVMYVPTRRPAPFAIFQSILKSKPPVTKSQLEIDPMFVLRNLGPGKAVLDRSLFARELLQERTLLEGELGAVGGQDSEAAERMIYLERRLTDKVVKLPNKQAKKARRELYELKQKHGVDDLTLLKAHAELTAKLARNVAFVDDVWAKALAWLTRAGYTEGDKLTVSGRAARELCDGRPLTRAAALVAGKVDNLSTTELLAWLAFFVPMGGVEHPDDLPQVPAAVRDAVGDAVGDEEVCETSARLMYLWCEEKNVGKLCHFLPMTQLGAFVKTALRVSSYVEEMLPVLLAMEKFEVHNRLLNHQERLFYGIVTNRSLYVLKN